jgi:hypothetical protein
MLRLIRRLLCRYEFHAWTYDKERQEAWELGYVNFEHCPHCGAQKSSIGDFR